MRSARQEGTQAQSRLIFSGALRRLAVQASAIQPERPELLQKPGHKNPERIVTIKVARQKQNGDVASFEAHTAVQHAKYAYRCV
jgi:hypothetical protein